jgi:hypothetical protein
MRMARQVMAGGVDKPRLNVTQMSEVILRLVKKQEA